MKLMTFDAVKNAIILTIATNDHRVPMIMGERGIGKTDLVKEVTEDLEGFLVTIDANTLKEGEIGGLPYIDRIDSDGKTRSTVRYSIHNKLKEVILLSKKHPESYIILFIDEFNRCYTDVKRELFNLMLNREINGTKLPDNCYVICACNPSSSFEIYADTDYQVEELDEAQMDRFRWLPMKSSLEGWISWGMKNNEEGIPNIDNNIIEYLVDRPEFLNNISTSKEDIKSSPRSWAFASNAYRGYLKIKQNPVLGKFIKENDLLNTIAGDVGLTIASDFMAFLEDNKNPLPKPEKIFNPKNEGFKNGKLSKEMFKKISNESILRKNVLSRNCLRFIKNKFTKEMNETGNKENAVSEIFILQEKIFIELLTKALHADLMYSILLDLYQSKDDDDKNYLKHLLALKNIDILNSYTKLNQAF